MSATYKGKRILITGGLGFIGSNLAIKLVSLGAKVTLIDSLIPEYGGNLFNVKPIRGKIVINISDVRDSHSMDYLVQNQDIIFNLAGTLSHVDSMTDPFTDLEINCRSQLSILESCRRFNPEVKIIYAGTRNQYGKAKYLPVDEEHPQDPTDVNGINCIAGEFYHLLYYKVYKIRTSSLRLTNTFGPRHQMKHPRQGVLNWFIRQLLDGEKIELFGSGNQIRDINFVDDVVDAFLLTGLSEKVWGQVFNLGGSPTSLSDFVKLAIKIRGKGEFEIVKFPDDRKKIEIGDYIADYNKIVNTLGWKPKAGLEHGLRKTVQFYEKNKKYYW
ncbi:NAD-dependent epimerase [Candidatus Daviesbacteria bacterium RIFCSPHIGHO2_12_FULL_37_11]|uniref:NAD-dependent epimerase n=1 Tax=Candidatus Daviesbacteria bacterium RIFCSPHIGHO2_12_FULL_37_11 TaxID=1797777 RepID=A0A1F5K8I4_9BACT|nr:MAG: NAD-dependent epimerase [Candidatus Daviesbacteria bacterium RIFCSPHIGHO2_01_FULL_37_27]OGE37226.1 MAG: NAD-dependent epimerase [Candidatus Daviesbacteria bacterium RIFCSPHIGHO2_12_FULL_37_11]OGE46099.1 MAG: NAD-dependent epimerase [Candidatus Daviesbacteria bacterium RIFCSPLOWO2_01_FULL_37_10]